MSVTQGALHQQVERLYTDHHGWLQGWLRRKLGDAFVAADLAHDTFISVISAGATDEIREPRPFLATIARRLMAHRQRRKLLETSYLELLAALPEELAPSPEPAIAGAGSGAAGGPGAGWPAAQGEGSLFVGASAGA